MTIGSGAVSMQDLVAVARGAPVSIDGSALAKVEAAREVVNRAAVSEELVYGLNTGLGHSRNDEMQRDSLVSMQPSLVAMHAGTFGARLPSEVVRAAMMSQLVGITRGGSGATVASAYALRDMLNAGVHPIVFELGSVGASDLGHMSSIAMVAMGSGRAELDGREMEGSAALASAGLVPLEPQPGEGLTLVSSNGMTVGYGAIVIDRARQLLNASDTVCGVSLEAIGGNASIVDAEIARAKGSSGQEESATRIRQVVAQSKVTYGDSVGVQDPLSFRVTPQVHGAVRDLLGFASESLQTELNAKSNNPLVSVAEDRMISNGNFHPLLVALVFDALRPALAHVGQIADRRLGQLWDGFLSDAMSLDPQVLLNPPPAMAGLLSRYAVAARYTRLRHLAGSTSLDIPSLDLGVEDHATNAFESVARTSEALDVLEDMLLVELLVAHRRLEDDAAVGRHGKGTEAVMYLIEETLSRLPRASSVSQVLDHMRDELLYSLSAVVDGLDPRRTTSDGRTVDPTA